MKFWFIAFLLISLSVRGQVFTFGPKLGLNFSSLNFDNRFSVNGNGYRIVTKEAKIGVATGVFFRIKVKKILILPEVLFTQDRSNIIIYSSLDSENKQLQFNKIDIPFNVGYLVTKALRINGGIVAGIILSNQIKGFSSIVNYSPKISPANMIWNWQLGIGFDIKKRITLDMKYEGNLGTHQNNISFLGENIQIAQRKNTFQLTLGIALVPFKK